MNKNRWRPVNNLKLLHYGVREKRIEKQSPFKIIVFPVSPPKIKTGNIRPSKNAGIYKLFRKQVTIKQAGRMQYEKSPPKTTINPHFHAIQKKA